MKEDLVKKEEQLEEAMQSNYSEEGDGPAVKRIVVETIGESIIRIHFSHCAFRMPGFGVFWEFADQLQQKTIGSIKIWRDEEKYDRGIIVIERNLTTLFSDTGVENAVCCITNWIEEFEVSYEDD